MQDVKTDMEDSGNYPPSHNNPAGYPFYKWGKGEFQDKGKYFGKFVLMIFITSCVVILFSSLISKTRQERIRMLEAKKTLEKQASRLEEENLRLQNEYSSLKNDPVRIEKEARENWGYIKPDEVFYERYNFHIKSVTRKEPAKVAPQNRWKAFLFDGPFPWQIPALIILIATAYYLISYHCEYRKLHRSNS